MVNSEPPSWTTGAVGAALGFVRGKDRLTDDERSRCPQLVRSDYDPAAASRVAWREGLATVAHGLLFPFGYIPNRHRSERRRDIRTIVFVHGLAANRACFFALQTWLKACGYRRQLSFNHRDGPSIEALAIQLKRQIDSQVKGGRIDIVAHSLGGLIARLYVQQLGGARRVDRLVTLATPHQGTYASMFVPSAFVRQLEPGCSFMEHLESLRPPLDVAFHAFAADGDQFVHPRDSALLPFGRNRMFHGQGHNSLLLSPVVLSAVQQALAAPVGQ